MSDPVLQKKILKSLIKFLPLISEEGGIRTNISKNELISKIVKEAIIDQKSVESSLDLIELIFQKFGCLDPYALSEGKWEFASFPSSLFSKSWLSMIADNNASFFSDGWWKDVSNTEEQREWIKYLETTRVDAIAKKSLKPIRIVFVAWALIKLEGRILFCEREDIKRENTPHFVLAGGRLNVDDLNEHFNQPDKKKFLESDVHF